jgi:outer membrane protein OmpA-like peptidoglycan-associated protein
MQCCTWSLNQDSTPAENGLWRAYHLDSAVNGPSSDYRPFFASNNELIYSQLRNTKEVTYISKNEADYPSQIRFTTRQDTFWRGSEHFTSNGLDTLMTHLGNLSTAPKEAMYFTQCILDSFLNSECDVYESLKDSLRKLGSSINLTGSSATEPFFTDQGSHGRLFFTSNRPGGFGGYDLYYADKEADGKFGVAVNLGPRINTPFDERTAYFDEENNLLFFASEGHLGFGGLDMFLSPYDIDNQTFEKAENLLKPVNSSYDDYGFHMSPNREFGAIASNRDSSLSMRSPHCCDDIFVLNTTQRRLTVIGQTYTLNDQGRVFLDSTNITLYRAAQDTFPLDGMLAPTGKFDYNIEFGNEYMVVAEKSGYSEDSVFFSLDQPRKAQFSDTLYVDLELQKISSSFDPDSFLVATVYWDFDKHMLREDASDSIKKVYNFLGRNPSFGIIIASHTDALGREIYNQKLSEKRSESVYNYLLTDLGFPIDRMRWIGYGEQYPVAPNRLSNGRDNKEGRQLNRRTEFWAYPIR